MRVKKSAAEACDAGKVYVGGRAVKPSYTLKIGDEVEIRLGQPIYSILLFKANYCIVRSNFQLIGGRTVATVTVDKMSSALGYLIFGLLE